MKTLAPRIVLPLLTALSAGGATPASGLTEEQALEAVERFVAAWNSRDPAAFAATLEYPHVRPAPSGGGRVFATAEEYAASIDFDLVIATGWDTSRLDSRRLIHLGRDKAHVAGQYTRYRSDGSKIWSNQVGYVVTERDGVVGIQARFAAGLVLESEEERRAAAEAALAVVERFMAAFNARDEEAWAATLHYPHVRLAGDDLRVWETAEEYMDGFDFPTFAERYGWQRSEFESVEAVQVSGTGVNVALTATRYDAQGRPLHSFPTFYLVTKEEGRWGIRARSSFAP